MKPNNNAPTNLVEFESQSKKKRKRKKKKKFNDFNSQVPSGGMNNVFPSAPAPVARPEERKFVEPPVVKPVEEKTDNANNSQPNVLEEDEVVKF